jgi:hypothetical protein
MCRLKKSLSSALHKLSLPPVQNKRQCGRRIQRTCALSASAIALIPPFQPLFWDTPPQLREQKICGSASQCGASCCLLFCNFLLRFLGSLGTPARVDPSLLNAPFIATLFLQINLIAALHHAIALLPRTGLAGSNGGTNWLANQSLQSAMTGSQSDLTNDSVRHPIFHPAMHVFLWSRLFLN